jgi:AbrB family looped-hinge helix DNA binding protein
MRITVKGQVTIPQAIREKYGFLPGTEIRFVDDGTTVRVIKAEGARGRGEAIVKHMRGRASTRLTTDEIMALTREDDEDSPAPRPPPPTPPSPESRRRRVAARVSRGRKDR